MSFIKFISSCWPLNTVQYEALKKKEDDLGVKAFEEWERSYPVNPHLSKLDRAKVKEYVTTLIQDLNKVPITSSNITSIEAHLIEISKESDRVREMLIEKIPNLKTDKDYIVLLKDKLNFTYTDKA